MKSGLIGAASVRMRPPPEQLWPHMEHFPTSVHSPEQYAPPVTVCPAVAIKFRLTKGVPMSKKASSRFLSPFIVPSFLRAKVKMETALIEQCSILSSTRDYEAVKETAKLIDSPVGELYRVIARADYTNPNNFLIESIPDYYKARMTLFMGISLRLGGELKAASKLVSETMTLAQKWDDPLTHYHCFKERAIIQSLDGNHNGAIEILHNVYGLARHLYQMRPAYYFDYLNAVAVELLEVGRLEEARRVSSIALKSPYLDRYNEFLETARDIAVRSMTVSKSFTPVDIDLREANLLRPEFSIVGRPYPMQQSAAEVTSLVEWKKVMAKTSKNQPGDAPEIDNDPASLKERAILHRDIADPHMTKEELLQVIEFVNKLKEKKREQK